MMEHKAANFRFVVNTEPPYEHHTITVQWEISEGGNPQNISC